MTPHHTFPSVKLAVAFSDASSSSTVAGAVPELNIVAPVSHFTQTTGGLRTNHSFLIFLANQQFVNQATAESVLRLGQIIHNPLIAPIEAQIIKNQNPSLCAALFDSTWFATAGVEQTHP